MRRRTLFVCGTAVALTVAVSQATAGLLGAAAFMLALLASAVTVGLLIDSALGETERKTNGGSGGTIGWMRRHRRITAARGVCGACHQLRDRLGSIWVCPACDKVTVEA